MFAMWHVNRGAEAARRWRLLLAPLATLVIATGLFGLFLMGLRAQRREEHRAEAMIQANLVSKAIQKSLTDLYVGTSELDILLRSHGFDTEGFPEWAAELHRRYPDLGLFQLAPEGVIRDVYPPEGFEAVLGRDLKASRARRMGALEALERRSLMFVGPVVLQPIQRLSIIARRPVFRDGQAHQFWGFTICVAWFDHIAQKELQGLDSRFRYRLTGHNPDAPQEAILTNAPGHAFQEGSRFDIPVPNGTWVLQLELVNRKDLPLAAMAGLAWAMSFALAFMVHVWIRGQERERGMLVERNAVLQAMAETDPLTGLLNRRAFLARARHALEPPVTEDNGWACLFLDLDHFKDINDRYGHEAGDVALQHLADSLRHHIRKSDPIGRLGGEEFVVLIHSDSETQAMGLAEKLRQHVSSLRIPWPGGAFGITVSLGVALRLPDENIEGLLRRADHAMYDGKESGRNRVCLAPDRKS